MTTMNSLSNERTAFIIFGITGDLAYRKLLPALYEIISKKRVPGSLYIIGFARRDWDNQKLRTIFQQAIEEKFPDGSTDKELLSSILDHIIYIRSAFDEDKGYEQLCLLLNELNIINRLYYLATPPESYINIIRKIGKHNLSFEGNGFTRVVIEKPYGRDLASAKLLDSQVHEVFNEEQIYRIDHYLGKETVQNILVFRFANGIFEPLWNRRYVDHIQITVAETVGVGNRAGYYETAGVIRDMFQNHIIQLLTLTAMESPVVFNPNAVRDEKLKVLRCLRPLVGEQVMKNTYRAQYVSGLIDGTRVPGYKDEPGVTATSRIETFLAVRIQIDNWRWAGVPFYIRSGKRLPRLMTEVAIQFKQAPLSLFERQNLAEDIPNMLILNIQPDEGITLTFGAKAPGSINEIRPVNMNFDYVKTFGKEPPDAYERLLIDAILGDATLFNRNDEVIAAWEFTDGILQAWEKYPVQYLPVYEAGTTGPPGADDFIRSDGRQWCSL